MVYQELITSGCSFSAMCESHNLAWPYHLSKSLNLNLKNFAEIAAGNSLITRNLLNGIYNRETKKPIIVVMWSNPNRFEIYLTKQENRKFDEIYNEMENDTAFTNFILNKSWIPSKISNWVKSGGGFGIWNYKSKDLNKLVKNYFKHHHNEEYQYMKTLENILMIQWYCEANKILLYNTVWQNIFNEKSNDKKGINKSNYDKKLLIDNYPTLFHLWDMIDWDQWIFYDNNKGLAEFSYEKFNEKFGEHPSSEAQKSFSDEVLLNEIQKDI